METIGDAYMVVAGAPEVTQLHAVNICDMALGMMLSMRDLRDPSNDSHMRIRVGRYNNVEKVNTVSLKM